MDARQVDVEGGPAAMQRVLRMLADESGLSRRALDDLAGLTTGHTERLLATHPSKNLGLMSALSLIGAVGFRVVLIEDPEARAKMLRQRKRDERKVRTGNHWRNAERLGIVQERAKSIGAMGGLAYFASMTPQQKTKRQRSAARARWRAYRRAKREARQAPPALPEVGSSNAQVARPVPVLSTRRRQCVVPAVD